MTPRDLVQRATVRRRALALAAALVCGPATLARAEVRIEGNATAVRVSTNRAAVSDVLAAIAKAFPVSYRASIPLDAAAAAAYAGTVTQVISRVLAGYNYVIKRDGDATEVVVYGRGSEVKIPPPGPKPASFLSRWR
jgi:hypothetical protein